MKKLLTLLFMLIPMLSWAQDLVEIDGIYYNIVEKGKAAEVTKSSGAKYAGDITIPESVEYNGTTYSVTSIRGSAFYGCSGLTSITIPNSVTSIGYYAFYGCSGLTSVTIPNSVTSIGWYAFWRCSGLTSVTIPNSVTSIGSSAFAGCSSLTSIHITDIAAWCNIQFLSSDSNPLYYVHHLFLNGEEVKDLIIPNSVTSIGEYTFSGCSGLTSITIPNSVTSIENDAFRECAGLTSITIPNSVTSIGNYAFYECSGLTSITIGSGVTWINYLAFASCKNLETVTCLAERVPMTDSNAFKDSYIEYATLRVPDQSVAAYSSEDPWKNFGKIEGANGGGTVDTGGNDNQAALEALQKELAEKKAEITSLQSDIDQKTNEINRLKKQLEDANGEIAPLLAQLNAREAEVKSLKDEMTTLKASVEELERTIAQLKEENTSLNQSNAILAESNSLLKGEVAELQQSNDELKESNEMYSRRNAELNEEVGNLQKENKQLAEAIASLQTEIATLGDELSLYRVGDLNKDGKTDLEDVVLLLTMDSYSGDADALAQLTEETVITLTQIDERLGDVEYYKLNGVKVDKPTQPGVYLVKKDGETKMIVVKK